MKARVKWVAAGLLALAGLAITAHGQVPAGGAGGDLSGIAPGPQPPGPPTVFSKLGVSKQQMEFCRRKLCKTPLGELLSNAKKPLTFLSGGILQPFCPLTPSAAELADPGAVGAAAKVKKDEAEAAERKKAVRLLGTVD